MVFGKGKKIKACLKNGVAVHMVDYSYCNKEKPICIETIGKNDAKYYTVNEAEKVWQALLNNGYIQY